MDTLILSLLQVWLRINYTGHKVEALAFNSTALGYLFAIVTQWWTPISNGSCWFRLPDLVNWSFGHDCIYKLQFLKIHLCTNKKNVILAMATNSWKTHFSSYYSNVFYFCSKCRKQNNHFLQMFSNYLMDFLFLSIFMCFFAKVCFNNCFNLNRIEQFVLLALFLIWVEKQILNL